MIDCQSAKLVFCYLIKWWWSGDTLSNELALAFYEEKSKVAGKLWAEVVSPVHQIGCNSRTINIWLSNTVVGYI